MPFLPIYQLILLRFLLHSYCRMLCKEAKNMFFVVLCILNYIICEKIITFAERKYSYKRYRKTL